MSETPRFSFYSDVCKLLTIVVGLFTLAAAWSTIATFWSGPRENLFSSAVVWIVSGLLANFFFRRGWPDLHARMVAKAKAHSDATKATQGAP